MISLSVTQLYNLVGVFASCYRAVHTAQARALVGRTPSQLHLCIASFSKVTEITHELYLLNGRSSHLKRDRCVVAVYVALLVSGSNSHSQIYL